MRRDVDRTERVREAMMTACICLIIWSTSSEQTTSIAMVLPVLANKGQFGGKSAFFIDSGTSLLFRRLNQVEISPGECVAGRTSIIGKIVELPNYSVPNFIGGDIGVDK